MLVGFKNRRYPKNLGASKGRFLRSQACEWSLLILGIGPFSFETQGSAAAQFGPELLTEAPRGFASHGVRPAASQMRRSRAVGKAILLIEVKYMIAEHVLGPMNIFFRFVESARVSSQLAFETWRMVVSIPGSQPFLLPFEGPPSKSSVNNGAFPIFFARTFICFLNSGTVLFR